MRPCYSSRWFRSRCSIGRRSGTRGDARPLESAKMEDEQRQPTLTFGVGQVHGSKGCSPPLRDRVVAARLGGFRRTELVDHLGVLGAEDMADPRRTVLENRRPLRQERRPSRRTIFSRNESAAPCAASVEGSQVTLPERPGDDVLPEAAEPHTPGLLAGGRRSKCHAVPPHIGHRSGAIRELAP